MAVSGVIRDRVTVRATGGRSVKVMKKADGLLAIARAEREKDPPRAAAAAAEAIRISRSGGYEAGAAWGFAELAYCKSLQGQPLEAFTDGKESLLLFRRLGDVRGEARALYAVATCYYHLSRWREALRNYEKSLVLSQRLKDGDQALATRVALNSVHNVLGNYATALAGCTLTIPLARKRGHDQYLMASLTDRGYANLELGRLSEAERAHGEALQIALRLKNRTRQAMALCNLGLAAHQAGRERMSVERYRRAEALADAVANPGLVAHAQYGRGAALTALGESAAAREALLACLQTGRRHRRPDSVGMAWLGLSELHLKRNDPVKALRDARRAEAIALETGNKSLLEAVRKTLALSRKSDILR